MTEINKAELLRKGIRGWQEPVVAEPGKARFLPIPHVQCFGSQLVLTRAFWIQNA